MAQPKTVILCVDDEENSLILRKLVLQKFGYEVISASSAKEALELLRVHRVDLVLSDQLMPGTTGTQLAKQVKATHLRVPIVIVSGVNEIPDDASNADLFISKLEGPALLSQKISEVLVRFQHAD